MYRYSCNITGFFVIVATIMFFTLTHAQPGSVDLSKLEQLKTNTESTSYKYKTDWDHVKPSDWSRLLYEPNIDIQKLEELFEEYWKDRDRGKGSGYNPGRRLIERRKVAEQYYQDPTLKARQIHELQKQSLKNVEQEWIPLGPFEEPSGNNGVGRINVIAFHPTDTLKMWAGAPAGGLWTSEDGGESWFQRAGHEAIGGVSDIAINPTDPDVMYLATGDGDGWDVTSYGLLKSQDGGMTWYLTSLVPELDGIPLFYLMDRVVVNPAQPNIVIATTYNGVFRSIDAGNTWNEALASIRLRDIQFHPTDPTILYGASYHHSDPIQFYKSVDSGSTWDSIPLPGITENPPRELERISIGVTLSAPNSVFLSVSDGAGGNLYKSEDNGINFESVVHPAELSKLYAGQSWFNWEIGINPLNKDEILIGGVGLRESQDAGEHWDQSGVGQSTGEYHPYSHVDNHFVGFQPITNTLWCANDGGIMKRDKAKGWMPKNKGLRVTQYYGLTVAQTQKKLIAAGSQDNGSHLFVGGNWRFVTGADGMIPLLNSIDHSKLLTSAQHGYYYKSLDGGHSFTESFNPADYNTVGPWTTKVEADHSDPSKVYLFLDKIYESSDFGINWIAKGNVPDGLSARAVRAFGFAPSDSNYIYVFESYYDFWVSQDGGQTWETKRNTRLNVPNDILIHPHDPNTAWLVSRNGVHYTDDGGDNWAYVNTGLSNSCDYSTLSCVSVYSIVGVGKCCDSLYIGTSNGVYASYNAGQSWQILGNNMPFSPVYDLQYHKIENKLYAATHGAGIWSYSLGPSKDVVDCTFLESEIIGAITEDTTFSTPHELYIGSSVSNQSLVTINASQGHNFSKEFSIESGSVIQAYLKHCYHNLIVDSTLVEHPNHHINYFIQDDSLNLYVDCLIDTVENHPNSNLLMSIDYNQNGIIDSTDLTIEHNTWDNSLTMSKGQDSIDPVWVDADFNFTSSENQAKLHVQYFWKMPIDKVNTNGQIYFSFHLRNNAYSFDYPRYSSCYLNYVFPIKINIPLSD